MTFLKGHFDHEKDLRRKACDFLQLAAEAQSLDAAREKLSAAVELADLIHRTANDAAAEVGQNIAGAS
jgi:hypothetical protein